MIDVHVCIGTACHLKGSYNVISYLQKKVEESHLTDKVEIRGIFCLGHCADAVSVRVNEGEVHSVSGSTVSEFWKKEVLPLT